MVHNPPKWQESTYVNIFLTLLLAGACTCNLRNVLQVSHLSSAVPKSIKSFSVIKRKAYVQMILQQKSTYEKDTSFQLNEKDTFDIYSYSSFFLFYFAHFFLTYVPQHSSVQEKATFL